MNLQRSRYPLTFGPTPIQPLKRLSDHLGAKCTCMQNARIATAASRSAATRRASWST
ncbi:MAG: 1-aminocyclopropane-1-carboxylate deaminase (EC [uncultured Paraburkholderia sp.]|nr:MAG: 1-aminocyclopropane-1-carboxylate deaminase (EC [uncultured Paraburkholderia sp.]CAH2784687.1 MAG: 1-aminocyclopropane-1-carboxylate deaminase (EC [uncultured Paraburkholderia sp.]CAH2918236.1 MAG: 1-aminocyclopropane-1-carboxylate deaminase (EC [uncultured Paraburkholderia sp.]CAH2919397.1 MAG: 1-aminocyclopropane-1-carboxylate deaminase (EC [uncultured Paraburkholderia sp.]